MAHGRVGSSGPRLNVIALVSGGKDSIYTILHCLRQGHRVVALANLYPLSAKTARPGGGDGDSHGETGSTRKRIGKTTVILPTDLEAWTLDLAANGADGDDHDPNSFMYQTAGHVLIPLLAGATGIPVFRRGISRAGARDTGLVYGGGRGPCSKQHDEDEGGEDEEDETESMYMLIRSILASPHLSSPTDKPTALSAGAVFSTYQRTRVESVAARLGLTSLAWLWMYPVLPRDSADTLPAEQEPASACFTAPGAIAEIPLAPPKGVDTGVPPLLRDMRRAGLDARIVKVAGSGLDDRFLWRSLTAPDGSAAEEVARTVVRFAGNDTQGAEAAVLGEGGEFETFVVDGPAALFSRGCIHVDMSSVERVSEDGGGVAWLRIRSARVVSREGGSSETMPPPTLPVCHGVAETWGRLVRVPGQLDARFEATLSAIAGMNGSWKGNVSDKVVTGETCQHGDALQQDAVALLDAAGVSADDHLSTQIVTLQCWTETARDIPYPSIQEEATALVKQINGVFSDCGFASPTQATLSTIVILRTMSDFAAVNSVYQTLFTEPLPPSRVTVACGDLLPRGINLKIMLMVQAQHISQMRFPGTAMRSPNSGVSFVREGLHVQSRSYWAPANIGPYSQAITASVPVSLPSTKAAAASNNVESPPLAPPASSPLQTTYIAGQIALVPATMELPAEVPESDTDGAGGADFALQATLALQHLWRIAAATGVGCLAGVVAYLPRSTTASPNSLGASVSALCTDQKAVLAASVWRHAWQYDGQRRNIIGQEDDESVVEDEDGDEDDVPDLWDQRFDYRHGRASTEANTAALYGSRSKLPPPGPPDGSLLRDGSRTPPPTFFAAEVESLPRDAAVEWQALLGVGVHGHVRGGGEGGASVRFIHLDLGRDSDNGLPATLACMVARAGNQVLVHATAVVPMSSVLGGEDEGAGKCVSDDRHRNLFWTGDGFGKVLRAVASRLRLLAGESERGDDGATVFAVPYLVFADRTALGHVDRYGNVATVPCWSLWSSEGQRLAFAALFKVVYNVVGSGETEN